ncbi:MAG: class I SAM-dependent methyltransferase [Chloroflexota bacterium]
MTHQREQRLIFDETAHLYDQFRPEYPPQVAQDLLTMAKLKSGNRILEIGCGTGKATVCFAPYGFPLVALEPGKEMAEFARHNCATYPNVEIQEAFFEDWPLEAESFHLIYSAMALHWVDPEIAFTKSADALIPGGMLAVLTNRAERGDTELDRAIQRAYEQVKDVKPFKAHPKTINHGRGGIVERFNDSDRFSTVFNAQYQHSRTFRADEYIQLMETMSDHRMMPADRREWLYGQIRTAIERFGGVIDLTYKVNLYFARRG